MARNGTSAIVRQLADFAHADHPNLIPLVTDDLHVWHVAIVGLTEPYAPKEGAPADETPVFVFELRLPETFPDKPPRLRALTPNGTYTRDHWVCLSFGEYHANQWNAAFGVIGCARELFNGLIVPPGSGIGLVQPPASDAAKLAFGRASRAWNERNLPDVMEAYRQFGRDHPELTAVRAPGRDDVVSVRHFTRWNKARARSDTLDAARRAYAALVSSGWEAGGIAALYPDADADALAALMETLVDDKAWDIAQPADAAGARAALERALADAGVTLDPAADLAALEHNTGVAPARVFNRLNARMQLELDDVPLDEPAA